MKKRTPVLVALIALIVVLLVGVGFVLFLSMKDNETDNPDTKVSDGTFAEFTDVEVFQNVPALIAEGTRISEAVDYGGDTYIIDVNGTDMNNYKEYLKDLEKAGFTKHSDNGEEGMDGYVYTASYTKDNLVVTVSFIEKADKTYIAACPDLPLSDHLIYDASYVADNDADAKTKVHMIELNDNGNSFVIQLKNGHFIVEDGGTANDAPYLLDYLESLVPEGEIPVIEAWFLNHAHSDHYGAFREIASDTKYSSRIYVEGVYYTEPSKALMEYLTNDSMEKSNNYIVLSTKALKSQSGEAPKLYRPQIGQKYYFSDLVIDVSLTQDQIPIEAFHSIDLNDTSMWLMHKIEGQKFLVGGDSGVTGTNTLMMLYDKDYLDVEVMAVLHHGINVFNYFTDYCTVDTYLYTVWRTGSLWEPGSTYGRDEENAYMQSTALENLSHGGGTVVLTFPYTVGTSEKMPACDWRYNFGTPVREVHK